MGFGKRFKRIAKKTAESGLKTGLKVATSKPGMFALGALTGGGATVGLQALKQSGLADTALSAVSKNPHAGALLGLAGSSVSAPGYGNMVENIRNVKHVIDDEIEETAAHASRGAVHGALEGTGGGLVGAIRRILFGGD